MNSTMFEKSNGARTSVRPCHRSIKSSGLKSALLLLQLIGLLFCLFITACQKKQTASSAPTPPLATDIDLGHGYVRRDGAIHFIGGGITGTGANATRIDMPSPELLKKLVQHQFGHLKPAEGLDAASFVALSGEYTRDKNRVYYKFAFDHSFIVSPLAKADPASFSLYRDGLVRDKSHVWYGDSLLSGLDPATVEMINSEFTVVRDKDSVYYRYDKIPSADPATFKHVGSGYYADTNRVYWCSTPIPDADPATFKVLGDSFVAKDKNHAYRSGEILEGFDVASLELILHNEAGYQIISDKNGFHVNAMIFPRSKPGKAEIIDNRTVKVGDLILLVEHSRNTPSTLFKENGKLMAESPAYEPMSRKVNGIISAEVTPEGMKNIRISPLPGSSVTPTVPGWQMEVFTQIHPVERLIELGEKIK
jgi:DKNYY family